MLPQRKLTQALPPIPAAILGHRLDQRVCPTYTPTLNPHRAQEGGAGGWTPISLQEPH